jgi:tRNA G10  N-methylase Trm11
MYGYTTTNKEDRLVKLVDEVIRQFSEMFVTNGFLVDLFPVRELHLHHAIYNILPMCVSVLVRHVPEWLPGAAWKKRVPKYRKSLYDMVNVTYDWVKQQVVRLSSLVY